MYNLPSGGQSLNGLEYKRFSTQKAKELCLKYGITFAPKSQSSVQGDSVLHVLNNKQEMLGNTNDYCILYAFYALYRVLVPTSVGTISLKWLEKLMEPNLGMN